MPLILTLKEGDDFFVRDDRFIVHEIVSDRQFTLMDDENPQKGIIAINDHRGVEVRPDVFVSAGIGHMTTTAAVAITAPREVLVLRGDLKRAELHP